MGKLSDQPKNGMGRSWKTLAGGKNVKNLQWKNENQ